MSSFEFWDSSREGLHDTWFNSYSSYNGTLYDNIGPSLSRFEDLSFGDPFRLSASKSLVKFAPPPLLGLDL